jgi:hypothetical protein
MTVIWECFPPLEDLVSMAEMVRSAHDDENEPPDFLDYLPPPLYDDDRWCCELCRELYGPKIF